jgi:MFS family permease
MFKLPRNVVSMGIVSFFNDLSSDMVFPLIPVFLTSVLGASAGFVGLIEGLADATSGLLKIFAGRLSDKYKRRKPFIVFGYSLSAIAKPILSLAQAPWHVLAVRFLDRVGKGTRDAPRDALISLSIEKHQAGRAFGFHRSADTMGAALGPLLAFLVLPLINNDLRTLFWFSFFASVIAVIVLVAFVKEVKSATMPTETFHVSVPRTSWTQLGTPFYIFLVCATIFSLGKTSEAFLILKAQNVGVVLALIPIIYFVYNIVFALLATPAGILSDKIGHRNTFMLGILSFIVSYILFANVTSITGIWLLFAFYGIQSALTEGVGRAIVSGLVNENMRATAFGLYNAFTGIALLPASFVFGIIWDTVGISSAFYYGAILGTISLVIFVFLRFKHD